MENEDKPTPQANEHPAAGGAAPVVETKPQADAPAGKFVNMPTHQVGKIKRDAAIAAQRKLAAEMGFSSVDEMKAAAGKMKQAARAPAPQANKPKPQGGQSQGAAPAQRTQPEAHDTSALQRELSELRAKNEKLAREKARAERTARERQRESLAAQAKSELRSIAASEGIVDSEYAIHLVMQHTEGWDEASLKKFDERTFFRNLRTKHPYLFGQVQQPANSGLPENPGAPKIGGSVQIANETQRGTPPQPAPRQPGGRVDTSKMSPREFQDYLRSKGVSIN